MKRRVELLEAAAQIKPGQFINDFLLKNINQRLDKLEETLELHVKKTENLH